MIVDVGFTVVDPIKVDVENPPGVIATEDALLMFHERVDVPADATMVGDAENDAMDGVEVFTVTVVVAIDVPKLFVMLNVYIVVDVGFTVVDVPVTIPTPLLIEMVPPA